METLHTGKSVKISKSKYFQRENSKKKKNHFLDFFLIFPGVIFLTQKSKCFLLATTATGISCLRPMKLIEFSTILTTIVLTGRPQCKVTDRSPAARHVAHDHQELCPFKVGKIWPLGESLVKNFKCKLMNGIFLLLKRGDFSELRSFSRSFVMFLSDCQAFRKRWKLLTYMKRN